MQTFVVEMGRCVGRPGYEFQFPDVYYEVLGPKISSERYWFKCHLAIPFQ